MTFPKPHVSLLLFLALLTTVPAMAEAPDVQPLLDAGQFDQVIRTLEQHLDANADDADARLALGVTTFLQGIEEFSQKMYVYGLRNPAEGGLGMMMPILAMQVRENPDPLPVTAEDVVALLERFEQALGEVDAILEPIGDAEAHMPLRIGTVKMDLNGDDQLTDDESLWRFYEALTMQGRRNQTDVNPQDQAQEFILGLDTADAYWLRGYCHLMSAATDFALAYDGTELFNRTGHLYFRKVDTPYPFLAQDMTNAQEEPFNARTILDFIAALHLVNQPLRDANRMPAAREHLKTMIDLSHKSWDAILAETDNDNEWVPGPDQQGAIGVNLTAEQVDAWKSFLGEADAILDGKKLLPFWRGSNDRLGINLKKVFTEPTPFDLILWVQGSAAAPYLEEGDLTDPDFWGRLNQQFGNNFPGFAFWIN